MWVLERVAALRPREDRLGPAAARGFGAFSLGLGLFELAAPGVLKRSLGLRHPSDAVVQGAYGAREIAAGAALLAQPHRPELMWARVAGDALDIATLIAGDRSDNPKRRTLHAALGGVLAITAADIALALRLSRPQPARRVFGHELPDFHHLRGAADTMNQHWNKTVLPAAGALNTRLVKKVLPAAVLLARRARLEDKRVLAGGGALLALAAGVATLAVLNAKKTRGGTSDMPEKGAIQRAVTVNKPRAELYRQWRDFPQAPRWMEIVESVTETGEGHHWVVRGPGDKTVSYDTVITEERDGEVLAWESVAGSKIRSSNRLEFRDAPGGRGTEIHARMTYDPPLGPLGKAAALVTQKAPEFQVLRDLRRFKQMVETGEIATTEGPGAAPSSKYNKK